jgi:hypothetical protein
MIFLIVEDLLLTTNIEELRENSDRRREMQSYVISLEGRCNHTLSPLKEMQSYVLPLGYYI